MRDLFRGFYSPSEEEYATLLDECVFVLDTSFLCSLYRLPRDARTEILAVLDRVSDRLWIPHHTALEYQRRRLNVIAGQKKKFDEVRDVLKLTRKQFKSDLAKLDLNKRHSVINPETLETRLGTLLDSFENELANSELEQQDIGDPDPLREEIERLLNGKIGAAPTSQQEIDDINKEGKSRYSKKIPPGYMDSGKADEKDGDHVYGGIMYERQYGDLVIWKQTLSEAKAKGWKSVVFLTDDVKEDWWWKVSGKTIGPRPELRDEIYRAAEVTQFHLYNSEQFLRVVGEHVGVRISEESLQAAMDLHEAIKLAEQHRPWIEASPKEIVEEIIPDFANDLINSDDQIVGAMADTNAFGYGLEEYEVVNAAYSESRHLIEFEVRLKISGDHNDDRPYCGNTVSARVSGTVKFSQNGWIVEDYKVEFCEVMW